MKKCLFFILLSLSLFSCGKEKEIDYTKLQNRNEVYYEINQEEPFTGIGIKKYENGQLQIIQHFKNGIEDGDFKIYYLNGQLQAEGIFKDGKVVKGELCFFGEN